MPGLTDSDPEQLRTMSERMILEMAALTHKGLVRANNEDSLFHDVRDRIMIICDGMGGHAGGNIASEMGVQVVASALRGLRPADWIDEDRVVETMKHAIFSANDHILGRARSDPALFDMGTTIVALAFMDDRVITANVGDSRIYRIADRVCEQVSEDHSLVAERIKAGEMDPDSPEARLLGNILTRALGMERITVDISVETLVPGDVYLLCTDGLCDLVEDHEMGEIVSAQRDLQTACVRMVDLANQRGGHDNITVALARVR
jgi:protein phosphatase